MELNEELKVILKTYNIDIYDLLNDLIEAEQEDIEEIRDNLTNKLEEALYIVSNIGL